MRLRAPPSHRRGQSRSWVDWPSCISLCSRTSARGLVGRGAHPSLLGSSQVGPGPSFLSCWLCLPFSQSTSEKHKFSGCIQARAQKRKWQSQRQSTEELAPPYPPCSRASPELKLCPPCSRASPEFKLVPASSTASTAIRSFLSHRAH